MNIKDINSKYIKITVTVLIAVIALLGVFEAGVIVGFNKAKFGHGFGENFERNFVNPRGKMLFKFNDGSIPPGGHGAVGKIVSISLPLMVVAGPDNLEKTILINDDTLIRQFKEELKKENLKVGDFIIVLGTPNDQGQVEAKLVRIAPPPPDIQSNNN